MSEDPTKDIHESDVRLIAFYLPQFHPFPENDNWWGKGFTEWTNVVKALPVFVGHDQPHLPADLGFYDLRVPEVRHQQIELAKTYGIDAFCYHFYWFSGKRLMERPLDDMLADSKADMPFCLCWANETWTRRWDGSDHEILIEQKYLMEDALGSIKALEPYLRDTRYLSHEGRKLIIIYRPQQLPEPNAWTDVWRSYAREVGLGELHLVCALTHGNWSYEKYGFDAGVEFPPHNSGGVDTSVASELGFFESFRGHCLDYRDVAEFYLNREYSFEPNVFCCVYPSWDNTARRKSRALITLNATPQNYEFWLHRSITKSRRRFPGREKLVFINAWNEWAEGCHLEPDRKHGHAYLEATSRAKKGSKVQGWAEFGLPQECGLDAQMVVTSGRLLLAKVRPKRKTWLRHSVHSIRDFIRVLRGKRIK